MNFKHLLKLKATLAEAVKGLLAKIETEGRTMTDEEETEVKSKLAEIEKINAQVELLQSAQNLDSAVVDDGEAKKAVVPSRSASAAIGRLAHSAKEEFKTLGEWFVAAVTNPDDSRLADDYHEYKSEQSMGSGAKGGFAVPERFLPGLMEVSPAAGLMRLGATVIPADPVSPDTKSTMVALDQNGVAHHKMYGGVEVCWLAEGGLKTATDFDLRTVSLQPQEMAGYIPITDKLLRNWRACETVVARLLSGAVLAAEDDAFINGDGIGKPHGAVPSGAAYVVNRAVAAQIALTDLQEMVARFRQLGTDGIWAFGSAAWAYLLSMTGQGGGATNIIQVDRATNAITIYGYPVYRHQRMPALGVRGDVTLIDRSAYLIQDGSGPMVDANPYLEWKNNKTLVRIVKYVDGTPWLTAPIMGEDGYLQSPIVVLDAPAAS